MSKSRLRQEYEDRMGVVEGNFELCNAAGKRCYLEASTGYWAKFEYNEAGMQVYCETSTGYWEKYEYNEAGKEVYFETFFGDVRDNRPNKAKIFTDEKGTKYKVVEVLK